MQRLTLLLALVALGCAHTLPEYATESSASAIRTAEEVGASDVPKAALHLQLAKEELDQAKALFAEGRKDEAVSLLDRSAADAELAVTLARQDAEKQAANDAMARVTQLRAENP